MTAPKTEDLFKMGDDLNDCWRQVESRVIQYHPFPVETPGPVLSIRRVGTRMRVCYGGVPVTDCKFAEKVKAVADLPAFRKRIEEARAALSAETASNLNSIRQWLGDPNAPR